MVRLTAVDFLRGLFCQLAVEGHTRIPFKDKQGFHRAMFSTSAWLQKKAGSYGVRPDFQFVNNSGYRSYAVRTALATLLSEQLLALEGKGWDVIAFGTGADYARSQLRRLPGGETLYREAAKEFLGHYQIKADV